jgi:hypothetical protein
VTTNQESQQPVNIVDRQFDSPLYVAGHITTEPEIYLAEKPYELSKFEFSVIKKGKFKTDAWFQLVCGATLGIGLTILGKVLNALIQKQTTTLDNWELWSIGAGILLAIIIKRCNLNKTADEIEFDDAKNYINQQFENSRRRRIHVQGKEEE